MHNEGYGTWSVCVSVPTCSATTRNKAPNKRYLQLQHDMGKKKKAFSLKMVHSKVWHRMLTATVPSHDVAFLSLIFQRPRFLVVSKANGRFSATWNTSLLDEYRATSHSSHCKAIQFIL